MWNKISSNKHLDKLAKQQAYRKHITTLYKMRPTIKVKPPTEYEFLKHKPKLEVNKRQRQDQIEKENNILVKKMLQKDSSIRGSQSVYIKDSLNSKIIKDKQRLIDMQNQRLVKKIKAVNSEYSKSRLQKDAQKYEKLKSSFAHSRMQQAYDLLQDPAETKMRYHKSLNRPRTANV